MAADLSVRLTTTVGWRVDSRRSEAMPAALSTDTVVVARSLRCVQKSKLVTISADSGGVGVGAPGCKARTSEAPEAFGAGVSTARRMVRRHRGGSRRPREVPLSMNRRASERCRLSMVLQCGSGASGVGPVYEPISGIHRCQTLIEQGDSPRSASGTTVAL